MQVWAAIRRQGDLVSSLCDVVRDVRSVRAARAKSERLRVLLSGIFSDNSILSRVLIAAHMRGLQPRGT